MKSCKKCLTLKPISEFSVNRRYKDGLQQECRACYAAMQTEYRCRRNPKVARMHAFRDQYPNKKQCVVCGAIKSRREFWGEGSGIEGTCKQCRERINNFRRKTDEVFRNVKRANTSKDNQKSPRQTLRRALNLALKRRATTNPITTDELMQMWRNQRGRCALSNVVMTWAKGVGMPTPTSISVDRIDRTKGYEKDNVRLLCNCINAFRGTMTDSELFDVLRQFHDFQFPMVSVLLSEAA